MKISKKDKQQMVWDAVINGGCKMQEAILSVNDFLEKKRQVAKRKRDIGPDVDIGPCMRRKIAVGLFEQGRGSVGPLSIAVKMGINASEARRYLHGKRFSGTIVENHDESSQYDAWGDVNTYGAWE